MSTSLFPIMEPQEVETDSTMPLYQEVAWDFIIGKPIFQNGEPIVVTGREAVQVWVWKALMTQRKRYEIYSWSFGHDLETLVGQSYSVHTKRAEAIRYVRETLTINPYITDVTEIQVDFAGSTLAIQATVHTVYGEVVVHA